MDDLINEQRFIQIVAWNSILDETERSAARKMYEDNLKLALWQSVMEEQKVAVDDDDDDSLLMRSMITTTSGTFCALDQHADPRQRPLIVTPTSTSTSFSSSLILSDANDSAASMSSFVAELELAIQVSSQDQALRHEEEERRRLADEEMLADLSALISDEEEKERRTREIEYEAELELAIQLSEQLDTFYSVLRPPS
jgi:hypothetical protein